VVVKLKQDYPVSEITKSIKVALKFKALKAKTIANLQLHQVQGGLEKLKRAKFPQVKTLDTFAFSISTLSV